MFHYCLGFSLLFNLKLLWEYYTFCKIFLNTNVYLYIRNINKVYLWDRYISSARVCSNPPLVTPNGRVVGLNKSRKYLVDDEIQVVCDEGYGILVSYDLRWSVELYTIYAACWQIIRLQRSCSQIFCEINYFCKILKTNQQGYNIVLW